MNRISEFFSSINWVIIPLLQSPCRWPLSHYVALMKFTGRKSGKEFITPVGYNRFEKTVWIALSDTSNRQWWRNYREPWPMQICLGGKWFSGTAVVINPDSPVFKAGFEQIFNCRPFIARILKLTDYNKKVGLTHAQLMIMQREGNGLVRLTLEH